jgi:aminoglycoside/choline kinase family phosphotransferase
VIDFQDALVAPALYDLATLLNDRATPNRLRPRLELALLDVFRERRPEIAGDEPDRFRARYHRFVLQKSLKIVGRFHYLEEVKGKTGYVSMLPDTLATLGRSLENLPDLGELHRLLARSFPELA